MIYTVNFVLVVIFHIIAVKLLAQLLGLWQLSHISINGDWMIGLILVSMQPTECAPQQCWHRNWAGNVSSVLVYFVILLYGLL
jgi:hypothetical protein